MIVLNCPHCRGTATYEETAPATLACSKCGKSFISMGRLPLPDWSIDMGPREYDGTIKAMYLPRRVCGYCGRVCKKNEYACSRCFCDLNKVATIDLKQQLTAVGGDPDDDDLYAYLALAYMTLEAHEALVRLLRLHPRLARELGASAELAERMHFIEPPPRSEVAERIQAKQCADALDADDSWQEEAIRGSLVGRIFYLCAAGILFYTGTVALAVTAMVFGYSLVLDEGIDYAEPAIAMITFGLGLLYMVRPRFERFRPLGPELHAADHPKLFAVIREMAVKADQEPPAAVYSVAMVNAFVVTRGGWLGFGGKKVMGIGWPLMQALTVSEFKAVLAHEFGHFHNGHVKLGPLLYRLREAVARLKIRLAEEENPVTAEPFLVFVNHFLEQSRAVARRQEYDADALAAQLQGPSALISGLSKANGAEKAFGHYFDDEVRPILLMGMRVPMAEGFVRFLESEPARRLIAESTDFSKFETEAHPESCHPPTGYRIKNVARFPEPNTPPENNSAATLLGNLEALEQGTLAYYFDEDGVLDFPLIPWSQVGRRFYLPYWQEYLYKDRTRYAGLTLGDLPALYRDPDPLVTTWGLDLSDTTADERADLLCYPFRCALGVALVQRGWTLGAVPGARLTVSKDQLTLDLHDLVTDVRYDPNDAHWDQIVAKTDLASVKLTDLGAPEKLENKRRRLQLQTKKPPLRAYFGNGYGGILGWTWLVSWMLSMGLLFSNTTFGGWCATILFFLPFVVGVALPLRQFLIARRGLGHWALDDETIVFTVGQQATTIHFREITRLAMRRISVADQKTQFGTWWTMDVSSAQATIHISHYREAGRSGRLAEEMIEKLAEWRADTWINTLEQGGTVAGKGWKAEKAGLRVAGRNELLSWNLLAKPSWVENNIVFHSRKQVEPVLTLPHHYPEAMTLLWLGLRLARVAGPTSVLGDFISVQRRRQGLGMLILIVFGLIGMSIGFAFLGPLMQHQNVAMNLPIFMVSMSIGVGFAVTAVLLRMRCKIFLHKNGVRLGGLFGTKTLNFDQLNLAGFTRTTSLPLFTTFWLAGDRVSMKFRCAGVNDSFINYIIEESAQGVARKALKQVRRGEEWHWLGKLSISKHGLTQTGRKAFKIPLREVAFEEGDEKWAVYNEARPEQRATFRLDADNGLAGMYLVLLLKEAAEQAEAQAPRQRRAG